MQLLENMSDEEILSLSDEQVKKKIKLKQAYEGVPIREKPEKPDYEEIPDPNTSIYEVDDVKAFFTDKAAAEEIAEALRTNVEFRCTTDYASKVGSDYKFIKKEPPSYDNWEEIAINEKRVYSREVYESIQNKLEKNKQLRKEYNRKMNDYRDYREQVEEIEEKVWAKVRSVREDFEEKNNYLKKFNEYVDLADGNEDDAWKFFNKAYDVSEDVVEFIKENKNE